MTDLNTDRKTYLFPQINKSKYFLDINNKNNEIEQIKSIWNQLLKNEEKK